MLNILDILLPHFFTKEPIPLITDPNLLHAITQIKSCPSVETAIKLALQILADKYQSQRFETYLYFHKFYEKDPNKLWRRTGFMHCTQQNYLFRVLLVQSGWLTDEHITLGHSLVWYFSPHQFLKVRLANGKLVAVDPWNYNFGASYGKYAMGFGMKTL